MNLPAYKFRSNDLLRILVDVGFSKNSVSAYIKLFRLKKAGKFKPPQTDQGNWVFTEDQLLDIAKHLSPGGKGEWRFENSL